MLFDTSVYDIFEGMTSISAVIKSICELHSNRRIVKVLFDDERSKQKSRELKFLSHKAQELGFALEATSSDVIDELCAGKTHGGIVAICTKRDFPVLNVNFLTNGSFFALIDGIEDPYNFGYSVRSLYAAGVDGIVLPERNWMDFAGTVARSAAGTSELANMCFCNSLEAVKFFKEQGFQIVCAGIRDSVSIYDHDFLKPVLLVAGGEKRGISGQILDLSDANVRIDYAREFMGSLPSASAISVIAFEIARQRAMKK